MFYGCTELKSVPKFNTKYATSMEYMFGFCTELRTVPILDMTNAVDSRQWLFYGCSKLDAETRQIWKAEGYNFKTHKFKNDKQKDYYGQII